VTAEVTTDGFLGGRLRITQPAEGYRAGVDPVFLAAAVPAKSGQRVLDLGCGVGTAALCLGARIAGLSLFGLELQEAYANLAETNAQENGIPLTVVRGDIGRMPEILRAQPFDHVLTNPPYFATDSRTTARDAGREAALSRAADMADWCDAALRRLRPGGQLTLIQVPDRLPGILAALAGRAAVTLHPLAAREGRDATRIVVAARKGRRDPLRIAAPTILHEGAHHECDGDDYTAAARAVLRNGEAWSWVAR
jgi:tRNA1Val (adenine37-N6)-methyltransferase